MVEENGTTFNCIKAAGVICIGSCSSFGNIQAAAPNPGGYKSVGQAWGIKTVNIAGCPPNLEKNPDDLDKLL